MTCYNIGPLQGGEMDANIQAMQAKQAGTAIENPVMQTEADRAIEAETGAIESTLIQDSLSRGTIFHKIWVLFKRIISVDPTDIVMDEIRNAMGLIGRNIAKGSPTGADLKKLDECGKWLQKKMPEQGEMQQKINTLKTNALNGIKRCFTREKAEANSLLSRAEVLCGRGDELFEKLEPLTFYMYDNKAALQLGEDLRGIRRLSPTGEEQTGDWKKLQENNDRLEKSLDLCSQHIADLKRDSEGAIDKNVAGLLEQAKQAGMSLDPSQINGRIEAI